MPVDTGALRRRLQGFDFQGLFLDELGWDKHSARHVIRVDGQAFTLDAIAEKRGFQVFQCTPDGRGAIPDRQVRMRVDRDVAKLAFEHLVVFVDGGKTEQTWHWARKEHGRPLATREDSYTSVQSGERLAQKLAQLAVSWEEEEQLTLPHVTGKVRAAFDVDRVTKRFYDRFKTEHARFLGFVEGIASQGDREWYASLMLNRLMFVYFIQKRGFLDGDVNYLRNRLGMMRRQGADRFLSFYRYFLLRLFHEGLGGQARTPELDELLGRVPYLNGGLFDLHELERDNRDIQIPDEAFERIFDFFDAYQWHLDERPLRADNEINPDVLGYIFEKYINQKQMGAYYTKEDITGYIARNTVIPFLFDSARKECAIAFRPEGGVWGLLRENHDRYIYEAVKKGADVALPAEIEAGVADVSRRGGWNRPAAPGVALPTESWREHVARRTRCLDLRAKLARGEVTSIDDLITHNLDVEQFAEDVIDNSEGPELLRAFYHALQNVTVLDPTCGSGAFLFAALNMLEPLYEACLERMEGFVEDLDRSEERHRPEKFSDFRKVLERVAEHPNRRHFVLKSIILGNLYGVDIMEEAVEICKLRLFLKLVAQVESADQIEPLPDIDFNVRAGNTLVGFATYDEVQKAVLGGLQTKMDLHGDMDRIDEAAEVADRAFQMFREMQTERGMDAAGFADAKADLRQRLRSLTDELDLYLATQYGIEPSDKAAFERWRTSHQPFHWFVEFYRIMTDGGFDVIIGNPPWREYAAVKREYRVLGYATETCGNLHGICTERALALRRQGGRMSFIVQLPLASSSRMVTVREALAEASGLLHIAPFDDRPDKLFDGLESGRAAIFLSKGGPTGGGTRLLTARYHRWYSEERPVLFAVIGYVGAELSHAVHGNFAKIGASHVARVFHKLDRGERQPLLSSLPSKRSEAFVFYQEATRYWVKATVGLPYYAHNGVPGAPAHGRYVYVNSAVRAHAVCSLLNSSLFWVYFVTYGDCFHLSERLVERFPIPPGLLNDDRPVTLGRELMIDLTSNAVRKTITTRDGDEISYDEFFASKSKAIIDRIDGVLAEHYGFTEDELDSIMNYDIKFRMGAE